jgi:hypothetical protein
VAPDACAAAADAAADALSSSACVRESHQVHVDQSFSHHSLSLSLSFSMTLPLPLTHSPLGMHVLLAGGRRVGVEAAADLFALPKEPAAALVFEELFDARHIAFGRRTQQLILLAHLSLSLYLSLLVLLVVVGSDSIAKRTNNLSLVIGPLCTRTAILLGAERARACVRWCECEWERGPMPCLADDDSTLMLTWSTIRTGSREASCWCRDGCE